ncbi:uncharacterized protein LOC121262376 [Juglans microcarpa x Juglans regia]|uniref:uncharacterized protein LOC121262376 n=1 Tax=Juglans microcarpa x Juglans regia TaxID=2249226 RepID=UPI001B7E864D|nr:uncharacterized protein LOC121262376 [Juglans microcarpa x Juglans regia]
MELGPRGMQHPLHPEHTLEITKGLWENCHDCGEKCKGVYVYHCSSCEFYLHPKCALLALTIKAESHDHPLSLLRRSLSFTCDTCGEKRNPCMSYFCITCSFMIHTQCALFPLNLKVTRHDHPLSLNLKYFPRLNQSENREICQLCVRKVDTKYKAYYCSSCDFAAHPRCATKIMVIRDKTFDPELKDDQPNETHLLGPDESTEPLFQIVDKINPGNGKAEIVTEIKHIWHEHHLKLAVELENDEKCNGCTQYLSSPHYCCLQCKFFLHKSCADLPRKKLHPLHNHPLALLPNKSQDEYGPEIFRCNACESLCNGFVYSCDGCRFQLDVPCSLIPTKFTHEGHDHPLFLLSSGNADSGKCTSCGKFRSLLIIRCADCEFSMDLECGTLPRTTKYGPYKQPFILSYTVEDDSGEYYCDICEEKRDPKHWFYYCADLLFAAHPKCILGDYPHIKFGHTYTYDVHEHPLTFVERTTDHPNCQACGNSQRSFIFECVKCDFILDHDCLRKMKK